MSLSSYQQHIAATLRKQGDHKQAEIYELTANFTLADWRAARGPGYWKVLDAIPLRQNDDRLNYQLEAIKNYLNQSR